MMQWEKWIPVALLLYLSVVAGHLAGNNWVNAINKNCQNKPIAENIQE